MYDQRCHRGNWLPVIGPRRSPEARGCFDSSYRKSTSDDLLHRRAQVVDGLACIVRETRLWKWKIEIRRVDSGQIVQAQQISISLTLSFLLRHAMICKSVQLNRVWYVCKGTFDKYFRVVCLQNIKPDEFIAIYCRVLCQVCS